jgi:hypothetical protein
MPPKMRAFFTSSSAAVKLVNVRGAPATGGAAGPDAG